MKRYIIGQDFNTKDWFIYDNETNYDICFCNTEEDAKIVVANLCNKSNGGKENAYIYRK